MRSLIAAVVTAFLIPLAGPVAVAAPADAAGGSHAKAGCRLTRPGYPEIKPGTRRGAVRAFQCVLNDAGFGPVTVDGFYGPQTQKVVDEFTGNFECCIPDPLRVRTWYWVILFTASHQLRGLEQGDSGIRVTTLQRALRADGETLVIDGDFGAQTTAQVKVLQGKCGLKKTGRIDEKTHFHLAMGGCKG